MADCPTHHNSIIRENMTPKLQKSRSEVALTQPSVCKSSSVRRLTKVPRTSLLLSTPAKRTVRITRHRPPSWSPWTKPLTTDARHTASSLHRRAILKQLGIAHFAVTPSLRTAFEVPVNDSTTTPVVCSLEVIYVAFGGFYVLVTTHTTGADRGTYSLDGPCAYAQAATAFRDAYTKTTHQEWMDGKDGSDDGRGQSVDDCSWARVFATVVPGTDHPRRLRRGFFMSAQQSATDLVVYNRRRIPV
ncbi:Aste57867_8044 [Aphanomyces stellatus]|uniref:Aste57867_8044 protein n=1 Tax=Aphanomyces stellatus TaxID=120398 RepID=A0A485KJ97_9STRA|nr:hypothetical protein As57867_008014 [Aphanomyces stellatus]VFT84936.1 Aste57867_8044 [Aphanomyces stellatus]